VMNKATELQSQHRLLVEELSSFKAHKLQLEARLEKASAQVRSMEEEVSRASVQSHHALKEAEELRAVCQRKEKEAVQLREAFEAEKARVEAEVRAATSNDPFRSQDHELRRISLSADKLSKDLHARELEVQSLQGQLRRKEGEVAGLSSALKSFETDMEAVRTENEELTERLAAGERQLKDLRRELSSQAASAQLEQGEIEGLKAQIQSERLRAQQKETQQKELVESTEAALREVNSWMVSTFALAHTPTVSASSDGLSVDSLLGQVRALRGLVESLASRLGAQVRKQQALLQSAEQAISTSREELDKQHALARQQAAQTQEQQQQIQQLSQQLQHQQRLLETQQKAAAAAAAQPQFDSSSSMRTPAKKGSANGQGGGGHQSVVLDLSCANGMLTPVHHSSMTNLSRGTGGELVVSRVSSAVKAAVHSSPAAKEASRLNAEILREVSFVICG
jgi:chromosome segregation ATPase